MIDGAVTGAFLQRGTPDFRRANIALFLAGFVTFAILYCTQPLLPVFSSHFGESPAQASLALSTTTAALGIAMLLAGTLSEVMGRKPVMLVSMISSALLLILTALSPNFTVLLVLRALQGVALAGLPAVAMAYLGEEVQRDSLGVAMGLYISGNSVGGLLGRLLTGMISDVVSWRAALIAIGVIGLFATGVFWRLLPPSRNFQARPFVPRQLAASLGRHLTDPGLLCLYAIAALVMGSFVTLYNYLGYRLTGAPYGLSQSAVGWIFLVYLVGTFSSSWMGGLSGRLGRRPVLVAGVLLMLAGLCLTISPDLAVIIAGVMVFTFGFFGSHSIASSWVGIRARVDRAQAASLYLLFYYLGSSVCGYGGGLLWSRSAWPGVAALIALLLVCALGVAVRLSRVPPRAAPAVDPTPLQASRSVTVPRT